MKKLTFFLLFLYLFIPMSVFAYSDYIIASGKNIGIELKSNNVIIVGSYNIGNYNALRETDLKLGDKILKINNYDITSAEMIEKIINKINDDNVMITYKRNNILNTTSIKLFKDYKGYKTGLYVRDTIRGVATLTYIDTNTKMFGALGHEILEKSTKSKFESDTGTIFSSVVTGITKSKDGNPGEKNARSNSKDIYGKVLENTNSGIFGEYITALPNMKLYKVAQPSEVKIGKAQILTVIEGEKVEAFDIQILKVNDNANTKNILFEVTDERLLAKTGGIIQGMSGSPIIQGDNIVGAVNFVVVDKTNRGYGIFITKMLEEAEN